MMMTKTNRLSTDRLFSTSQPARYSAPNSEPHTAQTSTPKIRATPMYSTDQVAASRRLTSCGLRLTVTKSRAIRARIAPTVAIHTHSGTSTATLPRLQGPTPTPSG